MLKKLVKNLISLLIGVVLVFIIGEVFVRGCNKYKAFNELDLPRYRKYDAEIHHCFIPNSKGRYAEKEYSTIYYINSLGMRDREYSVEKPENSYRIIVIGDSFVEGRGVNIEDTFTERLEVLLNKNNKSDAIRNFEVLNAGVASYSPILEYLALKNKLIGLEPDLVLLCFDFSDIQDDYEYSRTASFGKNGELIAVSIDEAVLNRPKKMFLIRFFERHSPFFLYARRKIKKLFAQASGNEEKEPEIHFGDIKTDRLFMLRDNVSIHDHWRCTAGYILKIRSMLDKENIKFVLVTYPYGHQVNKDEWSEGRQSWGFEKGKLYINDTMFYIIRGFCNRNTVNLIETHEELRKIKKKPLYYKYDGHFTMLGNRVMSEILYEKLLSIIM